MRAYARMGVGMEDPLRAMLMLGSEIIEPERLWLASGATVGKRCVLDARGGLHIGANANVSGGVQLLTGSHRLDSPRFEAYYETIVIGERAWVATGACEPCLSTRATRSAHADRGALSRSSGDSRRARRR